MRRLNKVHQRWSNKENAPILIKITALVCSSTFSAKQRTRGAKWKKNKKNKTQMTGGQMKKCGVKNRIFTCKKNAEDGEGNENLQRVGLCVYAATVGGSQW